MYVPVAVETVALDVLQRAGNKAYPVCVRALPRPAEESLLTPRLYYFDGNCTRPCGGPNLSVPADTLPPMSNATPWTTTAGNKFRCGFLIQR